MLSIIIPSHNRADLLAPCLRSLRQQAPADVEILVVDDSSRDGVVSQVARQFPKVQAIRLPRRSGFCKAVNVGIAATHGEIIELLNDDTEVTAGWADAALACFREPRVAAVAPLVLSWPDGKRVDSAGDRYYLGGVAAKRGHQRPITDDLLEPKRVFGASASSAFYRRSALEEIGGFPESFGSYFEDVDVAFRLGRAGYQTIYEPGCRVLHHISASHGRTRRSLLQQQSRNEERVFWRNVPSHLLLSALPKHAAVLLGKAWRRWQEGTLAPFLCGRLQCLTELADLHRHRRSIEGKQAELLVESTYWG